MKIALQGEIEGKCKKGGPATSLISNIVEASEQVTKNICLNLMNTEEVVKLSVLKKLPTLIHVMSTGDR